MTDSIMISNPDVIKSDPKDRIRSLIWKIVIATWLLMAIGSATRVMNAGLACPDWPLCYGTLIPSQQMNLQVFLEWFHRLDAAFVGISSLVLMASCWWNRSVIPTWIPWVATLAVSLIIFQGVLGGLTVTELLRFDIVTAHLGTALLFFITLVIMGTALSNYEPTSSLKFLPICSLIAAILVYIQSILGALVASRWALHQCLNYATLCGAMNSHLMGVVPPTLATILVVVMTMKNRTLPKSLRAIAHISGMLLLLQIILGVATFYLHLEVEPLTVSHQAVGAALLGTLVMQSVLTFKHS